MIPKGAKREAEVGPFALLDVSHLLAAHAIKRYEQRDPRAISVVVVHKSGADGPAGFEGIAASARFVVHNRDFPGFPYTYWISRDPDIDAGQPVIYRGQPDGVRSWHTGGVLNGIGVGIGVQGNYDGNWDLISRDLPKVETQPSPAQWLALESLVDWLARRHELDYLADPPDGIRSLTGHWEHGKPVCPGDALRSWVMKRRGEVQAPPDAFPFEGEVDTRLIGVEALQRALKLLGFDPGPVDGVRGYRTRAALEAFQRHHKLRADGWYGPRTAAALLVALRDEGLATRQALK